MFVPFFFRLLATFVVLCVCMTAVRAQDAATCTRVTAMQAGAEAYLAANPDTMTRQAYTDPQRLLAAKILWAGLPPSSGPPDGDRFVLYRHANGRILVVILNGDAPPAQPS